MYIWIKYLNIELFYQPCFLCSAHVYDAVELHPQNMTTPSTYDGEFPSVSNTSEMPLTMRSSQDIKPDKVQLQENAAYATTSGSSNYC